MVTPGRIVAAISLVMLLSSLVLGITKVPEAPWLGAALLAGSVFFPLAYVIVNYYTIATTEDRNDR